MRAGKRRETFLDISDRVSCCEGERGRCSVIGGYVAHDKRVPALRGRYVYADLCSGEIRSLKPRTSCARDDSATGLATHPGIDSFGVDARRRLYVADGGSGGVYRIVQR